MTDHTTTDAQTKARTAIADMQAAHQALNTEHEKLQRRFSQLQQRRGELLGAPLNRADAKAFVVGLVKQAAARFEDQAGLVPLFRALGTRESPVTVEHARAAKLGGSRHPILLPLNRLFGGELVSAQGNARLEFARMCYFFPEQIAAKMASMFDRYAEHFDEADGKGVNAMGVDARINELAKTEAEIEDVEARLSEVEPELSKLSRMLIQAGVLS